GAQPEWLGGAPQTTFPRLQQALLQGLFSKFMIDSETVLNTGVLKISASRDVLAERLALVARGVSTRTAVLVLGGIQLRAADGQLHLAATDMELSLRSSLEADVLGEGEAVVP